VGASADVFSGLGASVWMGATLDRSEQREFCFEISYTHMDQWEEFDGEGQTGKFDVLRVGWLCRTDPCCDRHWTWRAGLAYFRASGRPSEIDFDFVDIPIPGDYVGGYLGLGYEWDFGPWNRWSHGPELQVLGGFEVNGGDFGFTPTLRWGLSYRF